jgi:MiaB-like tRNA modifying enzyme
MRVYCETFGCTMNRGDTELMLGCLKEAGHEPTSNLSEADIIVVNTCAVKGPTQRRVLRRLRELRELDGKPIVVAGCLPLIDLGSIERLGTFAGLVSCHSLGSISTVVEKIAKGETNVRELTYQALEKPCLPKLRSSNISAIVAIAEGCTSNCSYCSVRMARGKLRSFDEKAILLEIKKALDNGGREILLTAQDTAAYGIDSGKTLPELLNKIVDIDGKFMVRVGMMNPKTTKHILPKLLDVYESEKIYKFVHLPVQSGDDDVLQAMRRGYTVDDFLKIVDGFRKKFDDLYLATDIIVGFPTEGEKEFMNSCELIEKIGPDKVNLTRFSPMLGTDAAKMKQVDEREVKRRSRLLNEICHSIGYEINRNYIGRTAECLVVEKGKRGNYTARLKNYKPAIVENAAIGEFAKINITEAKSIYLIGNIVR